MHFVLPVFQQMMVGGQEGRRIEIEIGREAITSFNMDGWHNDQRSEMGLVISGIRAALNIHAVEPSLELGL